MGQVRPTYVVFMAHILGFRSLSTHVREVNFSSRSSRGGWRVLCLMVTICMAQVACKPSAKLGPSGQVSLEYLGTGKSDSLFRLTNGSSRPVSLRGWSSMLGDTTSTYSIACETGQSESSVGIGPPFGSHSKNIEVSPGEQLRLTIPTDYIRQFRGAHCRLGLILQDGSVVHSGEFQP